MSEWMVAWEDAYGCFVSTEFFDSKAEAIAYGEKPKPLGKGSAMVLYRVEQQYALQEAD